MAEENDSYRQILERLDEIRAQMLKSYALKCEEAKERYDLNYPIQAINLHAHNKVTGQKKTLAEPTQFKRDIDNQLKAYARELEKEQKEDLKEKQEEKQAVENKRVEKEEAGMDPRREAFRERMREMDDQNRLAKEKDKDKGMEMG